MIHATRGGDNVLAPSARGSATSRIMIRARSSLSPARVRHAGWGCAEEAMNLHRWLAALALTACAQGGQVAYAPYSPENMHDRGGDGGGGGGGMM
jgi:hypothetical protein